MEWCKEHWKLIVTVVLVIAAVAVIILSGGTALGALGPVLAMIAQEGTIIGAVSGGLIGGLSSLLTGGSFLEGFEEGGVQRRDRRRDFWRTGRGRPGDREGDFLHF